MDQIENTVNAILQELKCPLPIDDNEEYYVLHDELMHLWQMSCYKYVIGLERVYINRMEDLDDLTDELYEDDLEEELIPALINIQNWIIQSRHFFLEQSKPFTSLIADSKVYEKHFTRKIMSEGEIIKLVKKTGNSYLFHSVNEAIIKNILLESSKALFEEIVREQNIRYAVMCNKDIGVAQRGIITKYLLIDIYEGLAHAYPCSEEEALALRPIERNEKLLYQKFGLDIEDYVDEPNMTTENIKPISYYERL